MTLTELTPAPKEEKNVRMIFHDVAKYIAWNEDVKRFSEIFSTFSAISYEIVSGDVFRQESRDAMKSCQRRHGTHRHRQRQDPAGARSVSGASPLPRTAVALPPRSTRRVPQLPIKTPAAEPESKTPPELSFRSGGGILHLRIHSSGNSVTEAILRCRASPESPA